jgi:AraC-like DNA-binding protein
MPIVTFKKFDPFSEINHAYLDCFFYLDVFDEEKVIADHFIPNGRFEMIFDLADRVRVKRDDGAWDLRPRISIAGHHVKGVQVECVGSRFQSIGALISLGKISSLIPNPLTRRYGRHVDIDELYPGTSTMLMRDLNSLHTIKHKVRLIDEFISEKISEVSGQPAFLDHSLRLILQYKGQISVGDLSSRVHCSTRHLRRSFLQHFGMSPKVFSSIIRLYETAGQITRGQTTMADIISDNGYFDRAHFYKEFTRIVGIAPSQYFGSNHILSGHFFDRAVATRISTPVTLV